MSPAGASWLGEAMRSGETMDGLHGVRVLAVDDDPAVVRIFAAVLRRFGAAVTVAGGGREAVERLAREPFDVVLSDISMPGMDGLELLRAVRTYDLDVPVVLVTGAPSVDSAALAVEYGAFRYLSKPVMPAELVDTVLRASRLHALARLKRDARDVGSPGRPSERAALEVRFGAALDHLTLAFQPIVVLGAKRAYGYEALLRTTEPSLPGPTDVLDAAEQLGRLPELGRAVRARVARDAGDAPPDVSLFVNLHAADLDDEELYAPEAPLSRIAHRVVLEITERASLCRVQNVTASVARLRALGFRIAIDDLGAGYAGLSSFAQLDPAIAKLDHSLVSGIDADPRRQRIVRSMRALCDELGVTVVAEGVETAAERDALASLGCDLLQGFLFGRPERGFAAPCW